MLSDNELPVLLLVYINSTWPQISGQLASSLLNLIFTWQPAQVCGLLFRSTSAPRSGWLSCVVCLFLYQQELHEEVGNRRTRNRSRRKATASAQKDVDQVLLALRLQGSIQGHLVREARWYLLRMISGDRWVGCRSSFCRLKRKPIVEMKKLSRMQEWQV